MEICVSLTFKHVIYNKCYFQEINDLITLIFKVDLLYSLQALQTFNMATHCRARNNLRIVSGHDDRSNSFLLGHVSFLAGQMYMMNYSFRGP